MNRSYVPRIVATRLYFDAQPVDAGFTAVPPTRQWACPCGAINLERKTRCGRCGEPWAPDRDETK